MTRRLAVLGILLALSIAQGWLDTADATRAESQVPGPPNVEVPHVEHGASRSQPLGPVVWQVDAQELPTPTAQSSTRPELEGAATPPTLSDLQQIALECNPTLAQARLAVSAAEGAYVQAGLYPNPTLGYVADEIGNDGSTGLQGMGVSQEIVITRKLRLGRAVASCGIEQAQQAWEVQRWRVMNDVRIGYYDALLAQKRIDVNEQLLDIEQQILKSTQQLRAAAEVSEVDVLQARVEVENVGLNLKEAQDRQLGSWRRLAAVIGRPELELTALAGDLTKDLPVITWEEAFSQILTQSPELAQAYAGVERARCGLARQCAERIPNFSVGTAVKYDTGSHSTVVDLEVGMPLPIFNRNQGNILQAQSAVISAEREVQRIELNLRERLATAFWQYSNARRRAATYTETILPYARKSLDLTTAGYREGEFAYLTLLTAQRTLNDITLRHLSSLEELWSQSVELEGMLLRGGLQGATGGR